MPATEKFPEGADVRPVGRLTIDTLTVTVDFASRVTVVVSTGIMPSELSNWIIIFASFDFSNPAFSGRGK